MTGSPHGVSRTRRFDRWFRYPAGFSPATLNQALGAAECRDGSVCVDPFAGSASAGTFALDSGVDFVGIEAHPLIAELGNLKFTRPGEPEELVAVGEQIADSVAKTSHLARAQGEPDLVVRCFARDVLDQLVALRTAVDSLQTHPWQNHAKWALVATLRDVACVKVGWPYQRPGVRRTATHAEPIKRFIARTQMMAQDLTGAPEPRMSRVQAGDSRLPQSWALALTDRIATGCVSSPPYLNNFDYADATRLELFFLGQARSWKEMCDRVRAEMIVATTQQARRDTAATAYEALSVYPSTFERVSRLVTTLERERVRRSRGKEYDRVLPSYFLGLARVLACLFDVLEPGGKSAWVIGDSAPYGIPVDTPALVLGLATELGFTPLEDRLLRVRGQRWRTNGSRHEIALTERIIIFQRPVAPER